MSTPASSGFSAFMKSTQAGKRKELSDGDLLLKTTRSGTTGPPSPHTSPPKKKAKVGTSSIPRLVASTPKFANKQVPTTAAASGKGKGKTASARSSTPAVLAASSSKQSASRPPGAHTAVPLKSARGRTTVTPDLSGLQIDSDAEHIQDPNIDPALYDEPFLQPPAKLPESNLSSDVTPRARRTATRPTLDVSLLHDEAVHGLRDELAKERRERKKMGEVLDLLIARVGLMEETAEEMGIELEDAHIEIDVLQQRLDELASGGEGIVEKDGQPYGKEDTNDPLAKLTKTYRRALLEAMGLSGTGDLPSPLTEIDIDENPGSTKYYLCKTDEGSVVTRLLRPDFSAGFAKQASWHGNLLEVVRGSGGASFGDLSREEILEYPRTKQQIALRRAFRSLQSSYRSQQKAKPVQEEAKRSNRRKARRTALSKRRTAIRASGMLPKVLLEPEWNWMFEFGYTSDQLSADEDTRERHYTTVEKLGHDDKFDIIVSPSFQNPAVTRIKHEVLDDAIRRQDEQASERSKTGKKGASRTRTAYDTELFAKRRIHEPIPYFAFHELYLRDVPDAAGIVIDPHTEDECSDVDQLANASNGNIKRRTREERAAIYTNSMELLELYTDNSPGGMLEALARRHDVEDHEMELGEEADGEEFDEDD